MARPTLYEQAIVDSIIEQLSQGTPLAEICRQDGMPTRRTVNNWTREHPEFAERYEAARDDGFDVIAADCLRIADTPQEGVIEKYEQVPIDNPDDPDGEPTTEFRIVERKTEDMLGHRKLQIETRLKLLAKWDPKRYGEKMTLAGDPENPLHNVPDEQIDRRLAELMAKQAGNKEQADG